MRQQASPCSCVTAKYPFYKLAYNKKPCTTVITVPLYVVSDLVIRSRKKNPLKKLIVTPLVNQYLDFYL
jgi:hypothetical protein